MVSLDVETRRSGNEDVICYTQFSVQDLGNSDKNSVKFGDRGG